MMDSSGIVFTFIWACIFVSFTLGCEEPLLGNAKLQATSQVSPERGADRARLNSQVAWTAKNSDFGQFLVVDLGEKKNVTSIAAQGRPFSSEFVQQYRIEFGNNGHDFAEYKDTEGNIKLFRGNKDGNTKQHNYFETPIIAQWIRINPTRWHDRISMRIELYGCTYIADTMGFDGKSVVLKDLSRDYIMSQRDHIRLRFRTNHANGILLYSRGTQGDVLALQLLDNQLLLNIDLGAKLMTSVTVGSLLDDNLWHDVMITRNRRDLVFIVDRVIVKRRIRGDFNQLDLNRELYVGGVININQEGLVEPENFTGCIENLFVNHSNFIAELKDTPGEPFWKVGTTFSCIPEQVVPVTFKSRDSHLRLKAYEHVPNINCSFDFRTFDNEGLLLYHKFVEGSVQLYLEQGKLKLMLDGEGSPKVDIDSFDQTFNDGQWHRVRLILAPNFAEVNVDGIPSTTHKKFTFRTGPEYVIGGGVANKQGFVGCMRYIGVDGNLIHPASIESNKIQGDLVFDACQMVDKCNPNPCEHGAKCQQNWETFACNCSQTGYDGAVCHTSQYPLSCEAFHQRNPTAKSLDTKIDVDGSGELEPFPVTCTFTPGRAAITELGHRNEKTITVNGFEKHGSFVQDITYNAEMPQIVELVNRSVSCKQHLSYECFRARLFNTPVPEKAPFVPFSWWVSRTNQQMDYWGGSLPGSKRCQCGLYGRCSDPNRWCNCDSGAETWQRDEGFLEEKDFLPVRQLRFGDTGSPMDNKQGRYSLGKLTCEGDKLFDNVVTFTLADGVINLPRFDWGHSADIYFEFKTSSKDAVFLHAQGPVDHIKVALLDGNQIQFSYNADNNSPSGSVTLSNHLNDDRWHSVRIERNRKEARIEVDGSHKKLIPEPMGQVRAIHLTSDLVVGATVDYREGYVGCMRAFMLNGHPIDLKGPAERGLYGVLPNCVGKCASNPCLNNGTCQDFYDRYLCDCRYTAFKGPICADEIGVNMRPDYMIKYEFEGTYKSTVAEKIRIGFTTTEQKGMLMGIVGRGGEYFNLMMSTSGELKMVFDFGFERQEIIYSDKSLADGQSHDVRIRRSHNGVQVHIKVDNYQEATYKYKLDATQDSQFDNLQYLYLGRNKSMGRGDGFTGCVSRVEFDDVYPLKLLFQEDKPANIMADPTTIQEDFCGIEPVTYAPEITQTRPPSGVDFDSSWYSSEGPQPADSAVLGGVLAVIFLALVVMAILIGRYASRHKGEYRTHEDMGARDAPDADTAIVQGQTGHDVTKKKEWFI